MVFEIEKTSNWSLVANKLLMIIILSMIVILSLIIKLLMKLILLIIIILLIPSSWDLDITHGTGYSANYCKIV